MNPTESSLLPRVLLGAAAGAAVSLGASASAEPIIIDVPDMTIGQNHSATGDIYFNPETGYVGSTRLTGTPSTASDYDLRYFEGSFGDPAGNSPAKPVISTFEDGKSFYGNVFVGSDGFALRLGLNATINASSGILPPMNGTETQYYNFLQNESTTGPWVAGGGGGFIPLFFRSNGLDLSPTARVFGWAEVSYNADQSLTIYRVGYDDLGDPSTTPDSYAPGDFGPIGTVPEPGSLSAAAVLGAAGLLAYRRRRRAAAGASEEATVNADVQA